jgi:hypothetical protein
MMTTSEAVLVLSHHLASPPLCLKLVMPPRPTFIAIAVLLTLTLILLLRPFLATLSFRTSSYCGLFDCSRSLRTWLVEEETRYAVALKRRQQLINRWGPTEDTVEA